MWSLHKLTEPEILEIFHSLENKLVEKIKIKRQTVDVIKTDLFGMLKLDDKVDCYRGSFVDKEMTIEVLFTNVAKELFDRNMMTTYEALKKLGDIQNSMATEMLPLKNETWLNENEKEIGRDAFLEIVKLYGLTVFEDGTIQLYFKAGDLFWGHEIITKVDCKGNHVNSMIAG